jgi:Uma2 family endonuclease
MTIHSPSTKLTYRDYLQIPADLLRHEIIDGEHFMNAAPSTYHQTILGRLHVELFRQIESTGKGRVLVAPTDVQLSPHDVVQPDLLVICTSRTSIITPTKIKGPPDLVIEILSPATAEHDTARKRELYERSGVAEYWIVDPEDQTIEQLVLKDGRYTVVPTAEVLHPAILDGVAVPVRSLW